MLILISCWWIKNKINTGRTLNNSANQIRQYIYLDWERTPPPPPPKTQGLKFGWPDLCFVHITLISDPKIKTVAQPKQRNQKISQKQYQLWYIRLIVSCKLSSKPIYHWWRLKKNEGKQIGITIFVMLLIIVLEMLFIICTVISYLPMTQYQA